MIRMIPAVEFEPVQTDHLNLNKRGKPFILTSPLGTLTLGLRDWQRHYGKMDRNLGVFPVKLVQFTATLSTYSHTNAASSSSSSRPTLTVNAKHGSQTRRRSRLSSRLVCFYKHAEMTSWSQLPSQEFITVREGTLFSPFPSGDKAFVARFRDIEANAVKVEKTKGSKRGIESEEDDGNYDDLEEDEEWDDEDDYDYTVTSKSRKAIDSKGKGKGKADDSPAAKRRKIKDLSDDEEASELSDNDQPNVTSSILPPCPPPKWQSIAAIGLTYTAPYERWLKTHSDQIFPEVKLCILKRSTSTSIALVRECNDENKYDEQYWKTQAELSNHSITYLKVQDGHKGAAEGETINEKKWIELACWPAGFPPCANDMDLAQIYKNEIVLGPENVSVKWYLDIARLDYHICHGLAVPHRYLLFQLIVLSHRTLSNPSKLGSSIGKDNTKELKTYDTVLCPYSSDGAPPKQPKGLSTSLKSYQLRAVGWMLEMEDIVRKKKGWSIDSLIRLEGSEYWFDVERMRFYTNKRPAHTMRCRGGILADEMGLGKTMEVFGVIVGNPSPLKSIVRSKQSNWWRSDDDEAWLFPSSATLVLAPSHLIIQWKSELDRHTSENLKVIVITTKPQYSKVSYKDVMNADVVLVSFQFLKNKASLNAVESFEVGREILNEAGVHAASSIAAIPGLDDEMPERRVESARLNAIITSAMELKRSKNALAKRSPVLEHFHWWRIVVDEGHEILCDHEPSKQTDSWRRPSHGKTKRNHMLDLVNGFQSTFRWYVTGSPFPHGMNSLIGALKFLGWTFTQGRSRRWATGGIDYNEMASQSRGHNDGSDGAARGEDGEEVEADNSGDENEGEGLRGGGDTYGPSILTSTKIGQTLRSQLHQLIRGKLYCRRTNESVKDEANIPPVVEEVLLLDMAAVERGIYAAAATRDKRDDLRLRQLCCHLQISEQDRHVIGEKPKTLHEIREIMVKHVYETISSQKTALASYRKKLSEKNAELANNPESKLIPGIENAIRAAKHSISTTEREITQLESEKTYFESIIDTISHNTNENCAICMEDFTKLTITTCGHLFCLECIKTWLTTQQRCPACRKPLTVRDLSEVADEGRQEIDDNHRRLMLQDQYGTKMARLITYIGEQLTQDPNARFIVFSQWDSLLHKVGDTLSENQIRNCYVRGNVHQRTNAIRDFKNDDDIRVIMLSLDNAASGTNLIEATHILLLDPVAGTAEKAKAVESQAVGRAHRLGQDKQITVVRFIVRDTVEYDLYLRNTAAAAASKRQNHESLAKIANPVWKNGEADESDENDDSENDDNGDEDDEAYVGCSRFY